MKHLSFALACALAFAGQSASKPAWCAESKPWQWRFQPPARSLWKITIFGRMKDLTVKDMIQSTFNSNGAQTSKRIHPEFVDQASHRALFDVHVIGRDALGSQLRWTFRQMTATLERDSWAEDSLGDEGMPTDMRAQVQKQRKLGLQKSRAREAAAEQRFNQSLDGASFSCAVDLQGKVTRFGGWEVWKKRVAQAIVVAKDGGYFDRAFRPVLMPEEMKAWVQGWTEGVPATPLVVGATWEFGAKVADIGILTPVSKVKRTLQSHGETGAVVAESAAFTIAPPVPKLEPNSVAYTFSCQGTRQSRLQVDRASGVPTRISRHLNIKGNRGVVNERGGVLQDEGFVLIQTSEIVAQLQPQRQK